MAADERDALQLELFAEAAELRRVDPAENMARFYIMVLQPNLFGGVDLVREWGRIGSAGRVVINHHGDRGQAVDALSGHFRAKRRHYATCGL